MKKFVKFVIFVLFMCLSITTICAFSGSNTISGNIIFDDENDKYNIRPTEIKVDLYENGDLVQSTIAKKEDGYKYSFNIANVNKDSNYNIKTSNSGSYNGNSITLSQNEEFIVEDFDKYEPNKSLEINIGDNNVVVIKLAKENGIIIWSKTSLTNDEKDQILEAVSNLNGIGRIKSVEFHSGSEEIGHKVNISNNTLVFEQKHVWSLIYMGSYTNVVSLKANNQLVMKLELSNLTITKRVTGQKTVDSYSFTIQFDNENLNGQYEDVTLEKGKGNFNLKDGETITIKNIPNYIGYTLSENVVENCQTYINGVETNVMKQNNCKDVIDIVVNNVMKEKESILDPTDEPEKKEDTLPEEKGEENKPIEDIPPQEEPEKKPQNTKPNVNVLIEIPNTGIK